MLAVTSDGSRTKMRDGGLRNGGGNVWISIQFGNYSSPREDSRIQLGEYTRGGPTSLTSNSVGREVDADPVFRMGIKSGRLGKCKGGGM